MAKTANIGPAVKRYLVEHGIKQSYLADKTGLTNSMISDLCTGIRSDQTIPCIVIWKICKALDVPISTFVNDDLLEV